MKISNQSNHEAICYFVAKIDKKESLPQTETKMNELSLENESISTVKAPPLKDQRVLDFWDQNAQFFDDHFQVPIPWTQEAVMPNNFNLALKHVQSTKDKLITHKLLTESSAATPKLLEDGYADPSATYALQKSLSKIPNAPSSARYVINCSFYSDDCFRPDCPADAAVDEAHPTTNDPNAAGFQLREFHCNSEQILSSIPKADMLHFMFCFNYNIESEDVANPRRMPSVTCSIIDPIGLIPPSLTQTKTSLSGPHRSEVYSFSVAIRLH